MQSLQIYLRESYNELINNVTWPKLPSLLNDTVVVIAATVLLSLLIALMDFVSNQLLSFIYQLNG